MFSSSTNGFPKSNINFDNLPVYLRPLKAHKKTKFEEKMSRVPLKEREPGYGCTFKDVSTYEKFVEYVEKGFKRPMTQKQIYDWLSKLYLKYLKSALQKDKENGTQIFSQIRSYDSILYKQLYEYNYRQLFEALRAVDCIANGKKEIYYTPQQILSGQFHKKQSHTQILSVPKNNISVVPKNNGQQFHKKQSHIQINSVPKNHDTRILVNNYCGQSKQNAHSNSPVSHNPFPGYNKVLELNDANKPYHLPHVIELGGGSTLPLDRYTMSQVSSMNRDTFGSLTKHGNCNAIWDKDSPNGYIVGGSYKKAHGMTNKDGRKSLLKGFSNSEPKKKTNRNKFNKMAEGLRNRQKNKALKKNKGKVVINSFLPRVGEKDLINIKTIKDGKNKGKAGYIGGGF